MIDAHQYRQRFLDIVDELRAALGYELRDQEPELDDELAMEMMYGNFDFAVVHSLKKRPDRILIECTFGEIPEGRFQQIAARLLEMNSALAELDGTVFCLDTDEKTVIYTLAQELEGLNGQSLLGKMTEVVWHGRRWLETRFIKDELNDQREPLDPLHLA